MRNFEELQEYTLMYKEVMKDANQRFTSSTEIIEYLIIKCFHISSHNDQLQEQLIRINKIINPDKYGFDPNDLPF